MERARVVLESVGKELQHACAMVDFQLEEGKHWAQKEGVSLRTFFSPRDFGLSGAKPPKGSVMDRRKDAGITYEPLWHFAAPDPLPTHVWPKSAPLLADGTLFMGSDSGVMWALDAASGNVRWQYDAHVRNEKGIWSSPVYYKGLVFFAAYNGNAYCINAENGCEIWISPASEWIDSSPLIIPSLGMVVLCLGYARDARKGGIAALDITTGEKIWEVEQTVAHRGSAAFSPAEERVIVGGAEGSILSIDARNGETVWELRTEKPIVSAPLICADQAIVAAASLDGKIRVVSLNEGGLIFEQETLDICLQTPLNV